MVEGGTGGSVVGTGGGTGGDVPEPDGCAAVDGTFEPVIESVSVTSPSGGTPVKGEALRFVVELSNAGTGVGPIEVAARITSLRFSDYEGVPAGSGSGTLCEDGATIEFEAGPFLDDDERSKYYAVGSGEYQIASLDLSSGDEVVTVSEPEAMGFHVETSGALLVPVVYDESYLGAIDGVTASSVEEYLIESFTRPVQIFTPDSGADPDGAGQFESFPGGFDEMMGVRHLFRTFSGFPGEETTDQGWCEDATYYAQNTLGMASAWETAPQGTRPERHGFDYLLALSPGLGGGVACGWIDVQVSGLIGSDLDRQQVVGVHESGHVFGAPHCDDVGNGSGGPLQGYVMCSGEKHGNYPEHFVFHSTSRGHMSSKWD